MEKAKIVIISGKEYFLTNKIYQTMKFFEESDAIDQTDSYTINAFSIKTWEKML